MLWQTWYDPPPVDVGSIGPDVVEGAELSWDAVVVAVRLAGAASIVVATPLIVVRIGVTVVTGFPLASTETQGSRGLSETRIPKTN